MPVDCPDTRQWPRNFAKVLNPNSYEPIPRFRRGFLPGRLTFLAAFVLQSLACPDHFPHYRGWRVRPCGPINSSGRHALWAYDLNGPKRSGGEACQTTNKLVVLPDHSSSELGRGPRSPCSTRLMLASRA
jgi:hypothetical protein